MVVIALLLSTFFICTKYGVSSENTAFPCQTPDIRKGFCVSIFDCPELIKLVHETGQDGANFAKESLCLGCVNNDSWVCCKKPRNTTDPSVIPTNDRIPDTSESVLTSETSESEEDLAMLKKDNLKKFKKTLKYCGEQHSGYREKVPGEVEIDEFPWVVQIKHAHDEPISMRCNGVIVDRNYILTTSKCGHRAQTAILGQYNVHKNISCKKHRTSECTESTKELSVTEVAHSNKDSDDQYGLTILHVKETITYTDYVRTICIDWKKTSLSTTKSSLQLSGWTEDTGDKKNEKYTTSSAENCFNIDEQLNKKIVEENISLMCLSVSSGDAPYCTFDFGGPLLYQFQYNQWYLDGFITNGHSKDDSSCSFSNVTGIYLTPKLIDFIVSNVAL